MSRTTYLSIPYASSQCVVRGLTAAAALLGLCHAVIQRLHHAASGQLA